MWNINTCRNIIPVAKCTCSTITCVFPGCKIRRITTSLLLINKPIIGKTLHVPTYLYFLNRNKLLSPSKEMVSYRWWDFYKDIMLNYEKIFLQETLNIHSGPCDLRPFHFENVLPCIIRPSISVTTVNGGVVLKYRDQCTTAVPYMFVRYKQK